MARISLPGTCTRPGSCAARIVVLSKTGRLIEQPFPLTVPAGRNFQVLLAGLAPGNWAIRGRDNRFQVSARVEAGKNIVLAVTPGGSYTVQPETRAGAFNSPAPLPKGD